MRYVKLGNSGLRVSEAALGTMTFGEDWGWGASKAESQKMFTHYAKAGGNFIDTANNYTDGSSERFLADFLAADRDHFVVASKFTLSDNKSDLNFGGNHRKNMLRSLKASLERLGTDHLDLLWLHMWDFTTPVEEVMRALDDVVRMGLVHYVGFSDSPAWVTAQAHTLAQLRGWSPLVAIQLPYSLGSRHAERAHFPMAETLGLSVTAWGLLAGGLLTNKYAQAGDTPTRYDANSFSERWQNLAAAVTEIAQDINASPAQVAIRWCCQHKQVIPILGARTLTQLEDNMGALAVSLSEQHMNQLNELSPIAYGFPVDFLSSENVHGLIFGDEYEKLEHARPFPYH